MNKLIIFCLILSLLACTKKQTKKSDATRINEKIDIFLDSVISNAAHGNNFHLAPIFFSKLDSNFFEQLVTGDSNFYQTPIAFCLNQTENYNNVEISDYVQNKYHNKIRYGTPTKDTMLYIFSPPIYNLDSSNYMVYSRMIFYKNDSLRWDHMVFIYSKNARHNYYLDYFLQRPDW